MRRSGLNESVDLDICPHLDICPTLLYVPAYTQTHRQTQTHPHRLLYKYLPATCAHRRRLRFLCPLEADLRSLQPRMLSFFNRVLSPLLSCCPCTCAPRLSHGSRWATRNTSLSSFSIFHLRMYRGGRKVARRKERSKVR